MLASWVGALLPWVKPKGDGGRGATSRLTTNRLPPDHVGG